MYAPNSLSFPLILHFHILPSLPQGRSQDFLSGVKVCKRSEPAPADHDRAQKKTKPYSILAARNLIRAVFPKIARRHFFNFNWFWAKFVPQSGSGLKIVPQAKIFSRIWSKLPKFVMGGGSFYPNDPWLRPCPFCTLTCIAVHPSNDLHNLPNVISTSPPPCRVPLYF